MVVSVSSNWGNTWDSTLIWSDDINWGRYPGGSRRRFTKPLSLTPPRTMFPLALSLAALTTAGLIRRIQPSGSVARYETRVGDNHHHVVCRSCGAIADIDCATGEAPCLTPSDSLGVLDGFVVDEAEVIYWGVCPDCAAATTSRSHP